MFAFCARTTGPIRADKISIDTNRYVEESKVGCSTRGAISHVSIAVECDFSLMYFACSGVADPIEAETTSFESSRIRQDFRVLISELSLYAAVVGSNFARFIIEEKAKSTLVCNAGLWG